MSLFDGLYAVVVNWNGGEDNLLCLASLVRQEGLAEGRVVFVDNGSTDGSLARVRAAFPGVVVLANGANLGFGEGSNRGAELALTRGARAVVFVNNDLTFPGGTLARLAESLAADPKLGLVGPLVLFAGEPPRVWCAGGRLDHRQNLSTLLGHGAAVTPEWRVDRDVDYVAGCAVMARADTLRTIGLFDASYFAYHEDLELGLRARRAGYGVRVLGGVTAVHAPSSSTGGGYSARRKWMMGLNSVRFLRQYGDRRAWARFALFDVLTWPALVLAALALAVVGRGQGRWRGALAKGLGMLEGALGRRVTAARLQAGGGWGLW